MNKYIRVSIPTDGSPLACSKNAMNWNPIQIRNSARAIIRLGDESKTYAVNNTPTHAKSKRIAMPCMLVLVEKICAIRKMLSVYSNAPRIRNDPPIFS